MNPSIESTLRKIEVQAKCLLVFAEMAKSDEYGEVNKRRFIDLALLSISDM